VLIFSFPSKSSFYTQPPVFMCCVVKPESLMIELGIFMHRIDVADMWIYVPRTRSG
jgi:hypothetical protein